MELDQYQVSTLVNVQKAVDNYARMKEAARAKRTRIAAELRKMADRIYRLTPSEDCLVVSPCELTKLADELES